MFMILGDAMTALSYVLIPFLLNKIQKDTSLIAGSSHFKLAALWRYYQTYFEQHVFISTAAQMFIISCGAGHIAKIIVLYRPLYKMESIIDMWTGVTSLATVWILYVARQSALRNIEKKLLP